MRDKRTPKDVCGEARLNPDFGSQKKCSFSLTRGVSSIEVTNTKMMLTFFQDQILSPEWRCPVNGGVPKETFHCM